jgi:hypothetical protein
MDSHGELIMAQLLRTIQVAIKTSPVGWPAIGLGPMMETCRYRFMSGLFRPDKRNTKFLLNKPHPDSDYYEFGYLRFAQCVVGLLRSGIRSSPWSSFEVRVCAIRPESVAEHFCPSILAYWTLTN